MTMECAYCTRALYGFGGRCLVCNRGICIVHRHRAGICKNCNTAQGVANILGVEPVFAPRCQGICRRISCRLGYICGVQCNKAEGHTGNCYCNPERRVPDIAHDEYPDGDTDDSDSPPILPKRRRIWDGARFLSTAKAADDANSTKRQLEPAPSADMNSLKRQKLSKDKRSPQYPDWLDTPYCSECRSRPVGDTCVHCSATGVHTSCSGCGKPTCSACLSSTGLCTACFLKDLEKSHSKKQANHSEIERRKSHREGKSLKSQQVSLGVLCRYKASVFLLLMFWQMFACGPSQGLSWDSSVSSYIEHLYSEGDSLAKASDTVAGTQFFFPETVGNLKHAWKLTGIWRKVEPPQACAPTSSLNGRGPSWARP